MKVRATLIAIREYEVDPKSYGTNIVEDMLKIDQENLEDDPFLFLDDARITVKIEEIS